MAGGSKSRIGSGFVVVFMTLLLMEFVSLSMAYKFFVGGKDGWVLNPSENFDHWAQRNRFQVNDTLFFKHKEAGSESVLVVKKEDYNSCNTTNPIVSLPAGDSLFRLDRSGAFYFIAGAADLCKKGLKLHLVVMAVRNKHQPPTATSLPPAESPPPEQRVDPSALDDAPSMAPGNSHRSAATVLARGSGTGLGFATLLVLMISFLRV